MTVRECYTKIGGDYDGVLRRFLNEDRIKKFLGMLLKDESMSKLRAAVMEEDYETAFRAAHTLKGVVLNLGLSHLASDSSALTEALRNRRMKEEIEPLFQAVERSHSEMLAAVNGLLGEMPKEGSDDEKTQ